MSKADAVIVLSHLMDADCKLSVESLKRVEKGVELYNAHDANYILTSGWAYRNDCDITIADVTADHICNFFNINSLTVLRERNSRDTVGDAIFSKVNFAKRQNWKKIYVVSSQYHIDRVKNIFNFIYGEYCTMSFIGVETSVSSQVMENEIESLNAFYKTFSGITQGNDMEILKRLRLKHPYYNGLVYPQY